VGSGGHLLGTGSAGTSVALSCLREELAAVLAISELHGCRLCGGEVHVGVMLFQVLDEVVVAAPWRRRGSIAREAWRKAQWMMMIMMMMMMMICAVKHAKIFMLTCWY
jgi:hypothetical protein